MVPPPVVSPRAGDEFADVAVVLVVAAPAAAEGVALSLGFTAAVEEEEEEEMVWACVEEDGGDELLGVAPKGGTVSDEQSSCPSTRGTSGGFGQGVPVAASQDSPFTVLLSLSLSDGWWSGVVVFLGVVSPLTTCPRAGLHELEATSLLEVEQEPDLMTASVPFIALLTALEEEDSPFS